MWIKHLFLGFIGLASGVGVAAGTFAFIIVIGVVPRMNCKMQPGGKYHSF